MYDLPAINDIYAIVDARNKAIDGFTQAVELAKSAQHVIKESVGFAMFAHKGTQPPIYDDKANNSLNLIGDPDAYLKAATRDTDMRIWAYLMERTGIRKIMDAQAIEEFEKTIREECPVVTVETVQATLDTLFASSGHMFARGVANTFSRLDRRFKSHDGFKVGARIILTRFCDDNGHISHYGRVKDTLLDMERAIAVLMGRTPMGYSMLNAISDSRPGWYPQQSVHEFEDFTIKIYQNGNAHLWFQNDDVVRKINEILRSWYGEVLPDGVHKEDNTGTKTGTAVSKDLQFYATPFDTAMDILDKVCWYGYEKSSMKVLEPSAGEGNMCHALIRSGFERDNILAVEYDETRANMIRRLGVSGQTINTNFFNMNPEPCYDLVFMNPPFYNTHWQDHVYHAWGFLKPGGKLIAILPVSAETGDSKKHKEFQKFVSKYSTRHDDFRDLPEGTFKGSGTMVNTVWIELKKP